MINSTIIYTNTGSENLCHKPKASIMNYLFIMLLFGYSIITQAQEQPLELAQLQVLKETSNRTDSIQTYQISFIVSDVHKVGKLELSVQHEGQTIVFQDFIRHRSEGKMKLIDGSNQKHELNRGRLVYTCGLPYEQIEVSICGKDHKGSTLPCLTSR